MKPLPPDTRSADDRADDESLPVGFAVLGVLIPNAALLIPYAGIWLRLAVAASLLGTVAALRLLRRRNAPLRPSFDSLLLGLVCTVVLYVPVWLLTRIPAVATASNVILQSAVSLGGLLSLALTAGVMGEELFWRGVLLPAFAERWSPPVAAVAVAALAALGFLAAPVWLLPLAVFGTALVWNALFLYTRDLTATILCHFAWDVLVLVLAPPF